MIKLSIIIPYYNVKTYTDELLDCLAPQITEEVEVILIDDGSKTPFATGYKWCQVYRQENGGASKARNAGLDRSSGEYVSFIDSDDIVSDKYVSTILKKIKTEKPDYIYLSWRTMAGGWQYNVKLINVSDKFPTFNLCVWNRVYKRSLIGKVRFNEKKKIAEDAEFIRSVDEKGKKAIISEYMYFYRSDTENSLTKQFSNGLLDMKRVVYYLPTVTADMTHLIKEFQKADKDAEVILLTNKCEIPELYKYAMVSKPIPIKGTELRGEPYSGFSKIIPPIKTQIVIWTAKTERIGGIETFIYNFCYQMNIYYDIVVLYDTIDILQLERLRKIVRCVKLTATTHIKCDTLIVNRITDKDPSNVMYDRKIQMCHTCKIVDTWEVPSDNDTTVYVSKVAKNSFDGDGVVINNMTRPSDIVRPLLLVSATRIGTFEKGKDRMIELANMLNEAHIDFLWLYYTDLEIYPKIENMIHVKPTLNIQGVIAMADYLVQLSDSEAFGYSIIEALEVGTPVITTPIAVLPELGFQDGVHGHIVPFDMQDIDLSIFNQKLDFTYTYDNEKRIKQWRKILGNTKPKHDYDPEKALTTIKVTTGYTDVALGVYIKEGTIIEMPTDRADTVYEAGYCEYYNG